MKINHFTSILISALSFVIFYIVAYTTYNALYLGLGLIISVLALYPFWRNNQQILLWYFVAYLPFEDGLLNPLTKNVTLIRILPDGILFVAFTIFVFLNLGNKTSFLRKGIEISLLGLIVDIVISAMINHIGPSVAIQGPYTMLRYAVILYFVSNLVIRNKEIITLMRTLSWIVIIESVISLIQFVLINTHSGVALFGYVFVQGTMSEWNVLGVYLAIVLTINLALMPTYQRDMEILAYGSIILSLTTIILTFSRESLISALLGGTIVLFYHHSYYLRWQHMKKVAPSIIGGMIIGILLLKMTFPTLSSSTTSTTSYQTTVQQKVSAIQNPGSYTQPTLASNARLYAIKNAGPAILKLSPFFGLGPGTYGSQPSYNDKAFYQKLGVGLLVSSPDAIFVADVEWLSILGQLGIVGVLFFALLILSFGVIGYHQWKTSSNDIARFLGVASMALVPIFFFEGIFGPFFEIRQISIFLWLLPALSIAAIREVQPSSQSVDPQLQDTIIRESVGTR